MILLLAAPGLGILEITAFMYGHYAKCALQVPTVLHTEARSLQDCRAGRDLAWPCSEQQCHDHA